MALRFLTDEIEKMSKAGYITDFKSALQEFVQKKGWGLPLYRVIKEAGPRHRRVFLMEVVIKGKSMGVGKGPSKKESEQAAAKIALSKIQKHRNKVPHRIISAVKKRINFKRRKSQ
jgi:ribonuclease-3